MTGPLLLALSMVPVCLLSGEARGDVVVQGNKAVFRTDRLEATFRGGTLVSLVNKATGETYLEGDGAPSLVGVRFGDRHVEGAQKASVSAKVGDGGAAALVEDGFGSGNQVQTTVKLDPQSGDLVVAQSAQSAAKGVAEVLWGVAGARADLAVIVPGQSGRRLVGPGGAGRFDWPIGWEAGLVIVQGAKGGFWVWAEDPECAHFKSLDVRRRDGRADLVLGSENPAPFDSLSGAKSCVWHVAVYQGDWRVPARRYRDWMVKSWGLQSRAEQHPAWVGTTRFVVSCGMDLKLLDALAARVDSKATLLYVPGWRRYDYDRMYPDYTAAPELLPFVKRAHEFGFHVMLHVNYFGCDPKNDLYAQLEPYQMTDPYSKEKLWWTWDRAEPPIKFAYINPASKAWRDLFVSRMTEAWKQYGFDALHLDQTLCIFNDSQGLRDGLNCAQGNRRLHQELRAALPEVALSGEGLDEVTTQSEAFAQHHALGIDFVGGTWDEYTIHTAHPIRSYLLAPFTMCYGYLGMTNPSNSQVYAAWREAYRHYGVLPTLAFPWADQVTQPTGFVRQVLDEGAFFASNQVAPDLDGPWPADVLFPYRAADGRRVTYAADAVGGTALRVEEGGRSRTISRTLHGLESVELPGTIPGWRVYDERRLMGLRPTAWYPYFDDPRDQTAFHLTTLPEGLTPEAILIGERLAIISLARAERPDGDLLRLLDQAQTGVRLYDGTEVQRGVGPLSMGGEVQAHFVSGGTLFQVHPPWRGGAKGAEGVGASFAEFKLRVPNGPQPVFDSQVFVDQGAVGKTDGVRFTVIARGVGGEKKATVTTDASQPKPLRLDLGGFAGKEITLILEVDAGEAHRADFDWGRWARPRVICAGSAAAEIGVVSPWTPVEVASGAGAGKLQPEPGKPQAFRLTGVFPGSVFLLRQPPVPVTLPADLAATPFVFSAQTYGGSDATHAQYVSAAAGPASCGGQSKPALNMHPPDGGVSRADFPLRLPDQPAVLTGFTGIRDGSKSEGVRFIVEVNGQSLLDRHMLPSSWQPLNVDLADYAGKPVVLTLKVDSEGSFAYDWAAWGEPRLVAK